MKFKYRVLPVLAFSLLGMMTDSTLALSVPETISKNQLVGTQSVSLAQAQVMA